MVGADSVLFCLGYCYGCWTKDDMDGAPTLGLLATLLQRLLIGLCACYDKVPWSRLVVSFPPPQTCYPIPPCPFYCQVANCNPCNNEDCKTMKSNGSSSSARQRMQVQTPTTRLRFMCRCRRPMPSGTTSDDQEQVQTKGKEQVQTKDGEATFSRGKLLPLRTDTNFWMMMEGALQLSIVESSF